MRLPTPDPIGALVVAHVPGEAVASRRAGSNARAVVLRLPHTASSSAYLGCQRGWSVGGVLPDVLDDAERERMARFRRVDDRKRYLFAHTALRLVLAPLVGTHPAQLQFTRGECPHCTGLHGRPAIAGASGPEFSLSHGGHLVGVAVARTPVGIDVQPVPRLEVMESALPRLHLAEQTEVLRLAPARQPRAFARLWARKEAYLKAVGTGLCAGTSRNDLTHTPAGWTLTDLTVEGCAVAMAFPAPALTAVTEDCPETVT